MGEPEVLDTRREPRDACYSNWEFRVRLGISIQHISHVIARALFKILAAVDGSSYASVVMQTVSRLASYVESEVTILSAVRPKRYRTSQSEGDDEKTFKDLHEKLTQKYFPRSLLAVEAESGRGPDVFPTQGATIHSKIVEGDPADAICSYAETMNADLVVVGKRGGRNIGATLLGSVSEKVVHKCTRSVLVAKEKVDASGWTDTLPIPTGRSPSVSHKN